MAGYLLWISPFVAVVITLMTRITQLSNKAVAALFFATVVELLARVAQAQADSHTVFAIKAVSALALTCFAGLTRIDLRFLFQSASSLTIFLSLYRNVGRLAGGGRVAAAGFGHLAPPLTALTLRTPS
jgi:hypothetical protein